MRAVIVQHDVQVDTGMRRSYPLQELQELLVAVPRVAGVRGDLAGCYLQRGEQRGGAVPLVVVVENKLYSVPYPAQLSKYIPIRSRGRPATVNAGRRPPVTCC